MAELMIVVRERISRCNGEPARVAEMLRTLADEINPSELPNLSAGIALVSAAAIKRYAAEGLSEREIAQRLGCNVYLVERALREQQTREIIRLDREEHLSPKEIASRLRVPLLRVRLTLVNADLRASLRAAKGDAP